MKWPGNGAELPNREPERSLGPLGISLPRGILSNPNPRVFDDAPIRYESGTLRSAGAGVLSTLRHPHKTFWRDLSFPVHVVGLPDYLCCATSTWTLKSPHSRSEEAVLKEHGCAFNSARSRKGAAPRLVWAD